MAQNYFKLEKKVVKVTEEDLKELQQRVMRQKMDELFEEPSTYEDDDDNRLVGTN